MRKPEHVQPPSISMLFSQLQLCHDKLNQAGERVTPSFWRTRQISGAAVWSGGWSRIDQPTAAFIHETLRGLLEEMIRTAQIALADKERSGPHS